MDYSIPVQLCYCSTLTGFCFFFFLFSFLIFSFVIFCSTTIFFYKYYSPFGKAFQARFWAFKTYLHTFSPTRISKTLKQHYSNSTTKHPIISLIGFFVCLSCSFVFYFNVLFILVHPFFLYFSYFNVLFILVHPFFLYFSFFFNFIICCFLF